MGFFEMQAKGAQVPMTPSGEPIDEITCDLSPGFASWLCESQGSVLISTYQAGKVAIVTCDGGQPAILFRDFEKPMGLALDGSHIALATRHHITVLTNAPLLARDYQPSEVGKYDSLFLPRVTYHTGDLSIHDVAFGTEGLWMVNTQFSCLAGLSHDYCFTLRWKPPFISALAPEDRCHLNGLAMRDGKPCYVTAFGTTDTPRGWRPSRATGGVLIEVPSGEIAVSGLAMPHSPRCHGDAVCFLNSGTGELCRRDRDSSQHDVVIRLPAYLRGLCIMGDLALVGLCRIRETHIFGGLPVQESYERLICGVSLVDVRRGIEVGRLEFQSGCTEIFEVQFLAGKRRPMLLNSSQEAGRQAFPASGQSYWLRAPTDR